MALIDRLTKIYEVYQNATDDLSKEEDHTVLLEFFDDYFSRSGAREVIQYFNMKGWYDPVDDIDDYDLEREYEYRNLGDPRQDVTLNDFNLEEIDVHLRNKGFIIMNDDENDALYYEIMKKDPNEPKTDLEKVVCKILNIAR
ncbi:MAG: hypothetical protein P4M11_01930 [Candidatus Pacebacteria bacterium]|nr:hypothetical protein [Candidatus Paceibacterota bacterium]